MDRVTIVCFNDDSTVTVDEWSLEDASDVTAKIHQMWDGWAYRDGTRLEMFDTGENQWTLVRYDIEGRVQQAMQYEYPDA